MLKLLEKIIQRLPKTSVIIFDTDKRFLLAGGGPLTRAGYDNQAMVGKSLSEIVPPDLYEIWNSHYERVLQGENFTFEARSSKGDWLFHEALPLYNNNNVLIGASIISYDFTDVEKISQIAQENEIRLHNFLNLSDDAILSINKEQNIVLFNEAAERIFGYKKQDVIGKPLSMLLPPDVVDIHSNYINTFQENLNIVAHMGERLNRRLYGIRSNGELFPLRATISKTLIDGNYFFTALIQDISAEVEKIRELEMAEIKFRGIFNNTFQFTGFMSPEGILLDANQAALKAQGVTSEEIIGKPFWETGWWSQSTYEQERLKDAIKRASQGEFVRYSVSHIDAKGDEVVIDFSIKPVFDKEGLVVQLIPEGRDISEMVAIRERLSASNRELQQFAYVASHDLQEPLRMVSSFLGLLEAEYADKLDENAESYIRYAVDGANRMKKLINDLLTYSRVNQMDVPLTEIPLKSIIEDVLLNLETAISESNAEIIVTGGMDNLPIVYGNHTRLIQLFQNLISNAIKFSQKTNIPKVCLSCIGQNKWLVIIIEDNGIGIPAEYRDRVFQVFQRLHSRSEYEGTGIGLAVCRRIVDAHHGKIYVDEPQVLGGARFVVELPINKEVYRPLHIDIEGTEQHEQHKRIATTS